MVEVKIEIDDSYRDYFEEVVKPQLQDSQNFGSFEDWLEGFTADQVDRHFNQLPQQGLQPSFSKFLLEKRDDNKVAKDQ